MVKVVVKWGKQSYDVEIDQTETAETFMTQLYTLTDVPVERMKILGIPGGMLKVTDDMSTKKLKDGLKLSLIGTAEGKESKAPEGQKIIFVEDMTAEQRAIAMNETVKGPLPVGIQNLGNTCYMNSVLQMLRTVPELGDAVRAYTPPAGTNPADVNLCRQYGALLEGMKRSTESFQPLGFMMSLHAKNPSFGERPGGKLQQQDAEECMRCILSSFASCMLEGEDASSNAIDRLFGFQLQDKLTCVESPEEHETKMRSDRFLFCHFGTATDPISHLHQGIKLSMEEMIDKDSSTLGRMAPFKKETAMASSPEYLLIQFARFGWKAEHKESGVEASRVKVGRAIQFPKKFDIYEMCTDDLKTELQVGRVKDSEQRDRDMEAAQEALKSGEDLVKGGANSDIPDKKYDTGTYEFVSCVSHAGRSANSGHYVAWAISERGEGQAKAGNKKQKQTEDTWLLFDDEKVTEKLDREVDLSGGRLDTQIAYFVLYRKLPAIVREPPTKDEAMPDAAKAAEGDKPAEPPAGGYPSGGDAPAGGSDKPTSMDTN